MLFVLVLVAANVLISSRGNALHQICIEINELQANVQHL
jgi:hypothetical protein